MATPPLTYPGVYIVEKLSGVLTTAGVATSITAEVRLGLGGDTSLAGVVGYSAIRPNPGSRERD